MFEIALLPLRKGKRINLNKNYLGSATASGMMLDKNIAIIAVQIPIRMINAREYFKVNLNKSDSLPTNPTAAQAIAILCGEIILPTTPPTEFAARNNVS